MAAVLLAEAIEKLDDPDGVTAAHLVELFALRDRLDAWLSAAVGAFDRDEQFLLDGAGSTVAWLKHRCRMTGADATRVSATARRLRSLPHTAQAWRDGGLSTGQVRAICANVPDRHADKFASAEDEMVPMLEPLAVHQTAAVMRAWRAAADDADPEPPGDEHPNALYVSATLDGRREIAGHLDADSAIELEQALAHAAVDDPDIALSQRNADALVEIARFFNDHNAKAGARRNRPHLTIVIRQDDDGRPEGRTLGGSPVSPAKLRQWFCDSMVARLMTSRSRVLDYGTEVPTVPVALWQAVAARDQGCRVEGCDRGPSRCEAHHVVPVSEGGATSIDNLVMCCSGHHHALHKPGWSAVLDADGTFHVTDPSGRTRSTRPPALRDGLWPPGPPDADDE